MLPKIKEGINYRESIWEWPTQQCPQRHQKLWNQVCRLLQSHLDTHRLGRWLHKTQKWLWKTNELLTHVVNDKDEIFEVKQGRYKTHYVPSNASSHDCTVDVDMWVNRDKLQLLSSNVIVTKNDEELQDPFKLFFEPHELPKAMEKKIVKLLRKNRLIYGSDATVNEGLGGFAWGIMDTTNDSSILLKSHSPLHGNPAQTHSTRGELFGLLACLRHISYLKSKFSMKLS